MSKLKKSIKAIIISICAVVVVAGSCLGAVLLSKKPNNSNDGDKPTDIGVKTEFVGAQLDLMNTINSIKNDIAVVEKVDSELIKQSGFSIDEIYAIEDSFVILNKNGTYQLHFYNVDELGTYHFTNLCDKLNIEVQFNDFELMRYNENYVYYTYTYYQDSSNYRKLAVSKIVEDDFVLINEYDALLYSDEDFKILDKYTSFELKFFNNYYVVYLGLKNAFGVQTTDIYVYNYTDEFVTDEDVIIYQNISSNYNYKFYENYYYIEEDNTFIIGAYDEINQKMQYLTLNYDLNENYNFEYTKYGIFILKKKGFESIEDLTDKAFLDEDTSHYYEYEYSYYNFNTETTKTITLSENSVKAEFVDVLGNKYLVLFEQGATNYSLNESGKFVYYDIENLNTILTYESVSNDNQVIYSNNTSILTKQGIFKVNNGKIAERVLEFGTRYSLKTQNFVCDNFIVYDANENKYIVMNMTGNFALENKFINYAEYDDGKYIVNDENLYYLLDIKTLKLDAIQNFDNTNKNSSLALVGFGVYVAGTENNYSLYNFKGELLEANIFSYEFVSYAKGTALKLTYTNNTTSYYFIDAISMFESTEEGSSSASQNLGETNNYNFTKSNILPYKDTSGGTSKTYWIGSTRSGSAEITHTNAGEKDSYSKLVLTVNPGYIATEYVATFIADGNEDAGFKYTFVYKNDYSALGTGSVKFIDDTRWYPSHETQDYICDRSFGLKITYYIQFKGNWNYYSVGDFDDAEDNYLNVDCMTYTVKLNDNGGSGGSGSFTYTYITSLSAKSFSVPTRTGYTFNGYYYNGTQIIDRSGDIKITNATYNTDFTATANWIPHTYNISYDYANGTKGTYNPTIATYDTEFTVSNPTRIGFTFSGWTLSGLSGNCTHYWGGEAQGSSSEAVWNVTATTFKNLHCNQDATVYFFAKWSANNYLIKYELKDGTAGSNAPTSTSYGVTTYISNPTKFGYTFAGWNISNMSTNCTHYFGGTASGSNSTASGVKATSFKNLRSTEGRVTFTATWSANTYTIAYEFNGGSVTSGSLPTTATYNGSDSFIPYYNISKIGYSFVNWTVTGMTDDCTHYYGLDNSSQNSTTGTSAVFGVAAIKFKNLRSTAGTVTFTANWTPCIYAISYDLASGTHGMTHPDSATYDATFVLSNPTRLGYIFSGWNITNMSTNCTHYIDGSSVGSIASTSGIKATTFQNLRSDTGTVNFTATWTPIIYNLTYDTNGGAFNAGTNNPATTTYDYVTTITSPVRHGYNFTGWKIQGGTKNGQTLSASANYPYETLYTFVNLSSTANDTIKLIAQWTAVTYDIKIVYNSHLTTQTYSATFEGWKNIPTPVKTGYVFDYWEITGMTSCGHTTDCECFISTDNGVCSHYYNSSASNSGAIRFTGTSLAKTSAKYFKNLACIQGTTVTFDAHWTKKTYKVINAGATYGATISTEYPKYDEVFSMTAPTSSPIGYHFNGWTITGANSTDENTALAITHYFGSSNSVDSSFTATTKTVASNVMYFKNLSSNAYVNESSTGAIVTITPVWAANTYIITFNMNNPDRYANNITTMSNISANYDSAVNISYPTKTGYTFLGWSLSTLSDDCTHYYGASSSSMTAFESANNAYKDPDNPNKYVILKQSYFKNLRSDTGTATLTANWKANTYTITYHYIPSSFNVGNYNASQLFTHINIAGNMTGTITYEIVYNDTYTALDYKNSRGEENFGLPVGLHFKLWSISSSELSGSTSVAKYNSSNVVETALSDSIKPNEKRIYGPGFTADGEINWKYYGSNIHLYACYDLAGINLRYYAPSTVAGENKLGSYSNISALNRNLKYTELFTFAGSALVVDGINLMGWMISADYFSSGDLTEQSVTVYNYKGTNYVAYQGVQGYWAYTNVDAFSYEDPTYFLYAVYSEEYSGSFDVLSFTYCTSTDSIFSSKYYSVGRSSQDPLPETVKIPKYYNDGTHGFLPVELIENHAFEHNYSSNQDQLKTIIWFDTIKEIGVQAFYGQLLLKNYTLNEGLVYINREAFLDCQSITEVVTPSTLLSIGESAYYTCYSLTTISLNEGLNTIGEYAFYGAAAVAGVLSLPSTLCGELGNYTFYCSGITSVEIPSGITKIGNMCFSYCSKLATVTFASNSSLSSISSSAFTSCSALTGINIPNSVTYIGDNAFSGNTKLASVTMPDSLEFLGQNSFYDCVNLESIVLPRGLTTIKDSTFSGCSKLVSITLYDGITTIGNSVFYNCYNLTTITIPDSVTQMGKSIFYGCSKLDVLNIPFVGKNRDSSSSSEGIFGYLFGASSYSQQNSYVPQNISEVSVTSPTKISNYAFANCSNIWGISFGKSLQTVGSNIFSGCSSLSNLTIPFLGTSRTDTTNGYLAYYWGISYEDDFPLDIVYVKLTDATIVPDCAFSQIGDVYISLNEGITSIGDYAFKYCQVHNIKDGVEQLNTISFPNTLKTIGNHAFDGSSNLTTVYFNEGLETIGEYAFYDCASLLNVVCPTTLKTIYNSAFSHCYSIQSVKLNTGLTTIKTWAFLQCTSLESITIPNTVTVIPGGCFEDCLRLASVTLHDNITEIGTYAFDDTVITSIKLPKNLVTIGTYAFQRCLISEVVIPSKVTSIGGYAFCSIVNLTSLKFENLNATISIGQSAFAYTNVTKVEFPTGASLTSNSFSGCTSLKILVFNSRITQKWPTGTAAPFYDSNNLEEVYLSEPQDVAFAGLFSDGGRGYGVISENGTFFNNAGICYNFDHMSFTYHEETQTYSFKAKGDITGGAGRSYPQYNMTEVYYDTIDVPTYYNDGIHGRHKVTEIEDYAFTNANVSCGLDTGKYDLKLPEQVEYIGDHAFENTNLFYTHNFPSTITYLGRYAFAGCRYFNTYISIPKLLTKIQDYAFYNCEYLKIEVPSDSALTYIGNYAFYAIDSYNVDWSGSITLPSKLKYIGDYAFYDIDRAYEYSTYNNMILPNSLLYLGKFAFYSDTWIRSVVLSNSLECINEGTFGSCSNIHSVYIPASVKTISASTNAHYINGPFYWCGNSSNNTCTFYLESDKIPSGWDASWNYTYYSTPYVFFNTPCLPDVVVKNINSGYKMTQDLDNDLFKYSATTKSSSNIGLTFEATSFVAIRFDMMVRTTDVNFDACVSIERSNGYTYYPCSLKGALTTDYQHVNAFLGEGDKMQIIFTNSSCSSYSYDLYVKNLRIDPIKQYEESYKYANSTGDSQTNSITVSGGRYNFSFSTKSSNGTNDILTSTNQGLIDSVSGFTYYATDACEISFMYRSYAETNYDFLLGFKNGTQVLTTRGSQSSSSYSTYTAKLSKGDKFSLFFRKDSSTNSFDDTGYIKNFSITKISQYDTTTDAIDYATAIGSVSSGSYPFKNATTTEAMDMTGPYTVISLTTAANSEVLSKRIYVTKPNATMTFVMWNYDLYSGLNSTGEGYYLAGPMIIVAKSRFNVNNNPYALNGVVSFGTFLLHRKCTAVTLTIPNPGGYYLYLNLGGFADGQDIMFDFYCAEAIGVEPVLSSYNGCFDRWDSGYADASSGVSWSRTYYNTNVDHWKNNYYDYLKTGDLYFKSANAGVDNSSSSTTYVAPADGLLTFDYSVSSESGYDIFVVYLNGEIMLTRSGEFNGNYAFSLHQGDKVKFEYIKDGSKGVGDDGVKVRNIHFKPCYVFSLDGYDDNNLYRQETCTSSNYHASSSECVYVVHPRMTNVLNRNTSYNNRLRYFSTRYYEGDSAFDSAGITIEFNGSQFENVYDRIEVYNMYSECVFTTKIYNSESSTGLNSVDFTGLTVMMTSFCYDEYFIIKFIKDSTIDYGTDRAQVNIGVDYEV